MCLGCYMQENRAQVLRAAAAGFIKSSSMKEYLCPVLLTLVIPQGKCNSILSMSHILTFKCLSLASLFTGLCQALYFQIHHEMSPFLLWKEQVFSEFAKEYYFFQGSPTIT